MANPGLSTKRLAISKAEANLLIVIGVAVFISVFSIVASKTLFDQMLYQNKVISKKEKALDTAKANLQSVNDLANSYQEFANATTNILGGNPQGDADRDGDNPRIILDALPSKYDFPALATSLEKVLKDNNITIASISGNDDEVAQSGVTSTDQPSPIEIPFKVSVSVDSTRGKDLMRLFERSIRPIQIQKATISQNSGALNIDIEATTYYQPEKVLNLREEPVK